MGVRSETGFIPEEVRFERMQIVYDVFEKAKVTSQEIVQRIFSEELMLWCAADSDHGASHEHRVLELARFSFARSPEIVDNIQELQVLALPISLSASLHDKVQIDRQSKTFHQELGALLCQLALPTLASDYGLTDWDIFSTVAMVYYHSNPERMIGGLNVPVLTELRDYIEDSLRERTDLPDTIEEMSSVFLLYRDLLRNGPFLEHTVLDDERLRLTEFGVWRLAIADKLDSCIPPDEANIRTILGSSKLVSDGILRPFVVDSSAEIDIAEELALRLNLGKGAAPDDLSRILYETVGRDYRRLHPTPLEASLFASGLRGRLNSLKSISQALMNGDMSYFSEMYGRRRMLLRKAAETGVLKHSLDRAVEQVNKEEEELLNKVKRKGEVNRITNERIIDLVDLAKTRISFHAAPCNAAHSEIEFEFPYDPL